MINENAISYGLLNEDEKAALRKTIIEDGYTPEQVKEKLGARTIATNGNVRTRAPNRYIKQTWKDHAVYAGERATMEEIENKSSSLDGEIAAKLGKVLRIMRKTAGLDTLDVKNTTGS